MSSLRRPVIRSTLSLSILMVGLLGAIGLLYVLYAQAHARERAIGFVRSGALAAQAWMEETLDRGGARAHAEVAREALGRGLATEAELFDARGRVVVALPEASPSRHRPDPAQWRRLRDLKMVILESDGGADQRLLAYLPLRTRRGTYVLRLSLAPSDLFGDWGDWNVLIAGYIGAAFLWLLAVALVFWPSRPAVDHRNQAALDAYEAAVERLGTHGRHLSAMHAEERRRWESLIEDKEAMARAGELTAGIVHEMRNGLGTIAGHARLLEGSPDAVSESARAIADECRALERMIRSFLDFVRNESPSIVSFDLCRMLSRVVSRERHARADAEFELECDAGAELSGDEALLERAFENIVRNAREAAGPGGHVRVRAAREEAGWSVTIEDDGAGFGAGQLSGKPRLFSTTKPGGLGLGLATAMKLVRLHAGEVLLRERRPRGALVQVRIPDASRDGTGEPNSRD